MSEFGPHGMPGWVALLIAYASGSIPTAYLAGRLLKGVDLRTVGSGNLGATNVYRNLGAVPAVIVLLLDAAKGYLPVLLLPHRVEGVWAFERQEYTLWAIAFGVAAIFGHLKPIFLLWKGGGKGVATAAGVFGALVPAALGVALIAFIVVAAGSGYVSLASIVAAAALAIATPIFAAGNTPLIVMAAFVGVAVIAMHAKNIQRLRAGTEPKTFGKKKEVA
ncbi:MAG: acyl-phosphate glycerol 3-phosphate acyltransferase [Gemmatimonas sp.]|nr:acyl-phosphate glycerol 3-phosphate acyltransferase [Gemmatimonas sp.]